MFNAIKEYIRGYSAGDRARITGFTLGLNRVGHFVVSAYSARSLRR